MSNVKNFQVTKNFKFLVNSTKKIVILEGSSRCFSAGTLVTTRNGLKPIEDIKIGDEVKSFNEKTGEIEFKKCLKLFYSPNTKKAVRIKLKDGRTIECTEDHKFYYKGAWTEIKHLLSLCNVKPKNKNNGDLEKD